MSENTSYQDNYDADTTDTPQETAVAEVSYAPTYRKKPEVVDARQFTGGYENAKALAVWLNEHDGLFKPEWEQRTFLFNDNKGALQEDVKEKFTVEHEVGGRRSIVPENGWLVFELDGTLSVLPNEKFSAVYEQV